MAAPNRARPSTSRLAPSQRGAARATHQPRPTRPLTGSSPFTLAITTFAGSGSNSSVDGTGTAASFQQLHGVAVTGGAAYVGDLTSIRKVDLTTSVVSTVAGSSTLAGCSDSTDHTQVRFNDIQDVATDGTYLYTVDDCTGHTDLRRTAIADGSTTTILTINGSLTLAARLSVGPSGMVYIADDFHEVLRYNLATQQLTTFSGFGSPGPACSAITADSTNLWTVCPSVHTYIYEIPLSGFDAGTYSIFKTDDPAYPSQDVPVISGRALFSDGSYLYGIGEAALIRRYSEADGTWGNAAGADAGYVNATGTDAQFMGIDGLAWDGSALWIGDTGNHRMRKGVSTSPLPSSQLPAETTTTRLPIGLVSTVAGDGTTSVFNGTSDAVVVGSYAYVATGGAIQKVDLRPGSTYGSVSTLAGGAPTSSCVDSTTGSAVRFDRISTIASDGYYLYTDGDCGNNPGEWVRRTSIATGATSLITAGISFDGHMTFAPDGNLYVMSGSYLYRVDPINDTVLYLAQPGSSYSIASDAANLYIAVPTYGSPVILRAPISNPTAFTTFASGIAFYALASGGDYLYASTGLTIDRFNKSTGQMSAVAGGAGGYADGIGPLADFRSITGMATDGAGGLYVADDVNYRLRKVVAAPIPPGQLLGSCNCGQDAWTGSPPGGGRDRAEPVDLGTGNFYESSTDATMPNIGIPFAFSRSYNSGDSTPTQSVPPAGGSAIDQPIPISLGWSSAYNVDLRQADSSGDLLLRTGDGQQILFYAEPGGTYEGSTGVHDTLVKNGDGTFTVTRQDLVTYQLDATGNITSEKDRNHEGLTFSYTSGHITSVSGNGAWTVTLGYTTGQLTSLSLPTSRSVGYAYDTSGRLHVVTDLRSNTTTYTYTTTSDGGGIPNLVKTITDPRNDIVTQNTYDANSRVTSQIDARNHTAYFGWNASTQTATFTDTRGKVWTYVFSSGALMSAADPYGDTTRYTYDGDGNTASVTDASSNTTTYTYDDADNLIEQDDPSSLGYNPQTWTYDAANDVTSYVDGRSTRRTTLYGYDSAGNLVCATLPSATPATSCAAAASSAKTTFGRDPSGTGLLTSITNANGHQTTLAYNAMGEPTSSTTALSEVTLLCYDAAGRMTDQIDPRAPGTETCSNLGSHTSIYGYDTADEMTSAQDPVGDTTSWTYDKDGNVSSMTNGRGNKTRYGYDAANNLTCVMAPTSTATTCSAAPTTSKTTYSYNNVGMINGRTDSDTHTWVWAYDNAGRLQSLTSPLSSVWNLTYWPTGLLKKKTLPSTDTISYGYDALDRPTSLTYSNTNTPNVTFTYDANGSRTQMTDGGGTVNYVYDDTNRMTSATRGTNAFSYLYYPAGQLQKVTYPGSGTEYYQYDSDERLCTATVNTTVSGCNGSNSSTVYYHYDAAGDVSTERFPGSVQSAVASDNADRLMSVTNTVGGNPLSSYSFGSRDGDGNPTSLTTASTTTYYGYDQLDRLTGVCSSSPCDPLNHLSTITGAVYGYDNVGNRTSLSQYSSGTQTSTSSYLYNADDQLCWFTPGTSTNACNSTPSGGTNYYPFTANGDEGVAGSWTYTYDSENRMISAANGTSTTTYTYDGDGNRLTATTGSTTTNYLWDTNEAMALLALEEDGSGNVLRRYTYGGTNLIEQTTSSVKYFLIPDAYGSVADMTSSTGATEWSYSYDPFGAATATKVDSGAPTNLNQFDGQYQDGITGLYDLRARVMDPTTGRFVQKDPLATADIDPYQANYIYALDNPLAFSDPAGLCVIGLFGSNCNNVVHRVIHTVVVVGKVVVKAGIGCVKGGVAGAIGVGLVTGVVAGPEAAPFGAAAGGAVGCVAGAAYQVFSPPDSPSIPWIPNPWIGASAVDFSSSFMCGKQE